MKNKAEILRKALGDVPDGTLLAERIRLALAVEEVRVAIEQALHPLPMRAMYLLAKITMFFKGLQR